jgi:hypothetical protein
LTVEAKLYLCEDKNYELLGTTIHRLKLYRKLTVEHEQYII